MMLLVKNLMCFTAKYISRLNIHYYHNRRYKSYIISLKAAIAGKSLISVGLGIDRILYFVFYDKILKIYKQHWSENFIDTFCQNTDNFQKSGRGVLQPACFIKRSVADSYKANMCPNTESIFTEKYLPKSKPIKVDILYRLPDKIDFVNCVDQICSMLPPRGL